MLIKSQNKRLLFTLEEHRVFIPGNDLSKIVIKGNQVSAVFASNGAGGGGTIFTESQTVEIGKYSTPERAEAVLDELYNAYDNQFTKTYNRPYESAEETVFYGSVYTLPEE